MRHTWIYLLALATIPFASCHDDKEQPEAPIGEKTYTASELELLYNGNAMPSKSVAISQTGNKATSASSPSLTFPKSGTG